MIETRYVDASKDKSMWLSRHDIPYDMNYPKKEVEVRTPVNHIWIYDRSGSMTWLLPELALDMIKHTETLNEGDFLSLGWFSTEGIYRFILKGSHVGKDKDYIKKMILENFAPISLTCFSGILEESLATVIPDTMPLSDKFALMFFTDGYPVVSNYTKEISKIKDACDKLGVILSSALLVGYGDYYNRNVLSDMASRLRGAMIHSSRLEEFSDPMTRFIQGNAVIEPMMEYDLSYNIGQNNHVLGVYTIESHGVVVRDMVNGMTVRVPSNCETIWTLTTKKPDYGTKVTPEKIIDGFYAGAIALLNSMDADLALEMMGKIGDKNLIDLINNAWTNDEFGRVSLVLFNATTSQFHRFIEGKDVKYLPNPNTFCLMDALDVMMKDEQCLFVPTDEAFKYKRIGVKTTPVAGSLKFERDAYCASPFDTTWNSSRLNLSLLCRITGMVDLGEEAQKYGFSQRYPTFVFRNYAIVKDGVLNVHVLPMHMSQETFTLLQRNKMISKNVKYDAKTVYPVMLSKVPLVNKAISSVEVNSEDYCNLLVQELDLMARYKVINSLFLEAYPKEDRKEESDFLSDEQIKFLDDKGITKKGFSPLVQKEESTDYYYAKEFDVKIAGFSSLPKLSDVLDKKYSGKLTPSQQLMLDEYDWFIDKYGSGSKTSVVYDLILSDIRRDLKTLRGVIARKRFVLLAGKRWFSDLTERDGAVVEYDDKKFTFSIRDIQVEY